MTDLGLFTRAERSFKDLGGPLPAAYRSAVALEVISDLRSERHRDWVSATVIGALGGELDQGVWVLRLYALDPGGVHISLRRSGNAAVEVRIAKPGRDRQRELGRALESAVSARRR